MVLLGASIQGQQVADELLAVEWNSLTADQILDDYRPLCWSAIGSSLALGAEDLEGLQQQVVSLAIERIQNGDIQPVQVLIEMAGDSWIDEVAVAALEQIKGQITDSAAVVQFCALVDHLAGFSLSGLRDGETQQVLQQIVNDHMLCGEPFEIELDHAKAIVLDVGGDPGLAMLRLMTAAMPLRAMHELWGYMCYHAESPITMESRETAQAAVDMLNAAYDRELFSNPWND